MATDHALRLGKLLGNLQSLEVLLRVYLLKVGSGAKGGGSARKPYWDLVEGEIVDEDEFSNYDTLGQLVKKYNDNIAHNDSTLVVDAHVVDIRDLLAHGRVAGTAQDTATLKILNFTKPNGGKAVVSASVLMDDAWFDKNILLCHDQIQKVGKAIDAHAI